MTLPRGGALALAACILAATACASKAPTEARVLTLDADASVYDLVDHAEYLEDATGALTFDDVRGGAMSKEWFTSPRSNPNFGFTHSVYWVRLQLHNPSDSASSLVVAFQYPLLDNVDVYIDASNGNVKHLVMGDHLPFSEREILHTEISFLVHIQPGQRQWVYARVRTESSMQVGLTVASVPGFVARTTRTKLFHGIYYGIMLVMALYNLFLYIVVRSRAYLMYVIFVVVFTCSQLALDGVAGRYFFANSPSLANVFTPLAVAATQIPPILFAQAFLDTAQRTPRLHRVLNGYMVFVALGIPLALFAPYGISIRFVAVTAMVTSIVSWGIGVVVWRIGYQPARFFVLAWTALIIGTVLYVLLMMGVLPANDLTTNVQRIGSAIEVSLLSFALADRISTIEREREAARAEAMAMDHDLLLTAAVQQLFLPKKDRYRNNGVELIGYYRPADRSGGDWWWYEPAGDGGTRVLVGDIAGHGAAAAMLTGAVAASYQNISKANRSQALPQNLQVMAQSFREISEGSHHMSLVGLEVDASRSSLRVWSAGAPPVLVLRADSSVVSLLATGSLIGDDQLELGQSSHDLQPGDRIFVFSDGLPEMVRPNGRQLGYAGVGRILASTRDDDLEGARNRIETRLDELRGSEPQLDDFCFVIVDVSLG